MGAFSSSYFSQNPKNLTKWQTFFVRCRTSDVTSTKNIPRGPTFVGSNPNLFSRWSTSDRSEAFNISRCSGCVESNPTKKLNPDNLSGNR